MALRTAAGAVTAVPLESAPPGKAPWGRAVFSLLSLAEIAVLITACAPPNPARAPAPAPAYREIQREEDVYRITVHWQGAPPADVEERLLTRCAELARREGAATFFVVNADFDLTNTTFLAEGSPLTPVFRVPEAPRTPDSGEPPPRTSLTVTIKLFRPGQAPQGYRLYDVEKILRLRRTLAGASRASRREWCGRPGGSVNAGCARHPG